MQDKIIFREMLSEVKELADTKGNVLTRKDVEEFFGNAQLEEEQLCLICEYLISQKIRVEDYESEEAIAKVIEPDEEIPKKTVQTDLSETDFIHMYRMDLEGVKPVSEEEELELFCRASGGEELAQSRLVEQKLGMVYELSVIYRGRELSQSDLIQEGNIALLLAVSQLPQKKNLSEFREYLFDQMQEAMEAVLAENRDMRNLDEKIADRVNHLQEAVKNLEEDLEHKVSIEELSAYLEMPVKEIKDILRMAGEEIEIQGCTKKEEV